MLKSLEVRRELAEHNQEPEISQFILCVWKNKKGMWRIGMVYKKSFKGCKEWAYPRAFSTGQHHFVLYSLKILRR